MTLSKFLVYWSLTFAILFIWAFSIATAMADVKDDLLANIRKRVGRARLRPTRRPTRCRSARSIPSR